MRIESDKYAVKDRIDHNRVNICVSAVPVIGGNETVNIFNCKQEAERIQGIYQIIGQLRKEYEVSV